jgi:hypothetical protein
MASYAAPACLKCAHFNEADTVGFTCAAFPEGIPDAVLVGGDPHTEPIEGDHGLRFEAKPA